ncbi:MAG: hypothetical protein Q3995_02565 [Eubacteriales bacterium]|nr:hypothetical protein [Eubacteriales bacterium]
MRMIEELYYGNILLSERNFKRDSEYAHILQLVARHENTLCSTLTEAQKECFGKFKECTAELESMAEVANFSLGFKLGLRITAESFIESSDQNLIAE